MCATATIGQFGEASVPRIVDEMLSQLTSVPTQLADTPGNETIFSLPLAPEEFVECVQ